VSKINQLSDKNTTWCFVSEPTASYNKRLFDLQWLHQEGYVTGTPSGGRGNTFFLDVEGSALVLREYLRGGLVQHINPRLYCWRGLQHTRAFRELHMLSYCAAKGLPASLGYACKVERRGLFYTAWLITHKLQGSTMADVLGTHDTRLADRDWQNVGKTIARFHNEGVWHADLNAHNILMDGDVVSLIDFDRARTVAPNSPKMKTNISRLHRSLLKEAGKGGYDFNSQGWATLVQAYEESSNAK